MSAQKEMPQNQKTESELVKKAHNDLAETLNKKIKDSKNEIKDLKDQIKDEQEELQDTLLRQKALLDPKAHGYIKVTVLFSRLGQPDSYSLLAKPEWTLSQLKRNIQWSLHYWMWFSDHQGCKLKLKGSLSFLGAYNTRSGGKNFGALVKGETDVVLYLYPSEKDQDNDGSFKGLY
jgi:hypothetical protein